MSQTTYRAYQPRMPVVRRMDSRANDMTATVQRASRSAAPIDQAGDPWRRADTADEVRDRGPPGPDADRPATDLRTAA
jgi:hypothetical protein